ncbi:glycosyltransferase involved in cell wall biosynthesis [Palleronia aestuarii]|uniref:Glycosyltransferase involved in cell wall biosynthesis n=1 Tax=Palleronia aestuarii TaxID=568105 RepID=A0A2W7NBX5_9RHOB|nr:glycosyltransferase [Palleronia aestuarii]PZX17123.1 glycosyltransferase involved in cell wall biosynthesis [Palleronia aestuarii]
MPDGAAGPGAIATPALRRGVRPHILFVHDDGPGQFGALGRYLATLGWPVTFAARAATAIPECGSLRYAPARAPSSRTHPYAQPFDRAALNGQGFARAALAAGRSGLRPDIVVSHAGPGAGLFARDVFRGVRTVAYAEWWYNHPAPDLAYLGATHGDLSDPDQAMVERGRNAAMALEIAAADRVLCPTAFQAAQFPDALRGGMTICHDGIDTEFFRPRSGGADPMDRPDALEGLAPSTPLVTYATRGMEPHRGFPQFMAALPAIQAARPDAVIAIAGTPSVAYGTDAMRRVDWLGEGLATPGLDRGRVVLLGKLPLRSYRWLLRRSDAHVYLTVPFVLSWSMLEAMATGARLVLSDTAPVTEFADDATARLVDMRAPDALSDAVLDVLADPWAAARRATAARDRVLARAAAREMLARRAALLGEIA